MKTLKLTIVAVASTLAISAGGVAFADGMKKRHGDRGGKMFERADANKDGKLSVDEMVQQATARFARADANADGEISLKEMTDAVQRRRDERRAKRILKRMDFNGDGKVTKSEVVSRARKRFALMDGDDNGVIEKNELRRGREGRRWKKRGRRHDRGNRRRQRNSSDL